MAYTLADIATHKSIDGQLVALTEDEKNSILEEWNSPVIKPYDQRRHSAYPSDTDFKEAYTEKEIGGDSTKWDAYVIAYNKVRTDNPKP